MTTSYPSAIDAPANCENDAVAAIEATLGTNPQAGFASVGARLNNIDQRFINERVFRASDYGGVQQAMDAAFTAGGGYAVLPWGVTVMPAPDAVTGRVYTLRRTVHVLGFGPQSVLKVPDGAGDFVAVFGHDLADSIDEATISDFTIDGNAANNPITYANETEWIAANKPRVAILLYKAQRTTVQNVQVRNLDCINTISMNGVVADCAVVGCHFDTPLSPINHDHSTIYTHGTACRVQDNHFVGHGFGARTAIEVHGDNQLVTGNIERGYDGAGVIVVADKVVVANNILSQPIRVGWGSTLSGLMIAGNVGA